MGNLKLKVFVIALGLSLALPALGAENAPAGAGVKQVDPETWVWEQRLDGFTDLLGAAGFWALSFGPLRKWPEVRFLARVGGTVLGLGAALVAAKDPAVQSAAVSAVQGVKRVLSPDPQLHALQKQAAAGVSAGNARR